MKVYFIPLPIRWENMSIIFTKRIVEIYFVKIIDLCFPTFAKNKCRITQFHYLYKIDFCSFFRKDNKLLLPYT